MKQKHYKITGECIECNHCLECETFQTWLGFDDEYKYYSECEDVCGNNGILVLQVRQMSSSNNEVTKKPISLVGYVKIVLSAFFSFGLFKDIVYSISFEKRLRLYNLVVMLWITIALIIGLIIDLYAECPYWGVIGAVGIAVFSYGGFQMFDFESKNISIYKCSKDSYGVWKLSRITDIDRLYNRHYLECLLPILFFYKRIKFLWSLKSCNTFLSGTDTNGISKLLENGIKDSEHLFAVVKGLLCRIKLDNGLGA